MRLADCPHHDAASEAAPRADACEVCGETWALRTCATCGAVRCCESHLAHNRAHYEETGHPVIREKGTPGAGFLWCYACNDYLE